MTATFPSAGRPAEGRKTFPTDWLNASAGGYLADWFAVNKFGSNNSVGTTAVEIWEPSSAAPYVTTAVQLEVISTSADDTAGGVGAQAVLVEGVNSLGALITETIATNGLSASAASTKYFFRTFRAYIPDGYCGTYSGTNVGNIVIRASGGGATHAYISAGLSQTQMAFSTIPLGHRALVHDFLFEPETNKPVTVLWELRHDILNTSSSMSPWRTVRQLFGVQEKVYIQFKVPFMIPQLTDIRVRAYTSTGTAKCSASYTYELHYDPGSYEVG